jgi:anti-sigma regulatory factor (Ser/Thr protein kinase)
MAQLTESRLIHVESELDTYIARVHARELLQRMGFGETARVEVETAVAELTQNVFRHGVRGMAWLRASQARFEIVCRDEGPGFAGTREMPSTGLGIGLDGVRRLMDRVTVEDLPGGGAQVQADRWLRTQPAAGPAWDAAVRTAVALRPARGEIRCSDGYVAAPTGEGMLLAVVDGLGHGDAAYAGAQVVLRHFAQHAREPLPLLLRGAHEAARGTRGAVAFAAVLGPKGILRAAGLGNVRGVVLGPGLHLPSVPGCLGVSWQEPVLTEMSAPSGARLLLETDGVESLPQLRVSGVSPRFLVEQALAGSTGRDDALAAVAECGG